MKLTPKKIFVALAILLAIGNFSCKKDDTPSPLPNNVNLKKGLLLYLPFSGNTADSSGNNNAVQSTGSGPVLTYDEHGYANSAFDGRGARLLITNNGSIKFDTAFTVSVIFMVRAMAYQAFLTMVNNVTGKGPTFTLGTNTVGNQNFDFSVVDRGNLCSNYGQVNMSNNIVTQFVPQPESWYNAICIYDKGRAEVYINGKLISTQSFNGTNALLCPDAKFVVGGWWDSDPLALNGKLDEVRMYDRVLNADEIHELSKAFQ